MNYLIFLAGFTTSNVLLIIYFTLIGKYELWKLKRLEEQSKLDMVSNDFISRINLERAMAKTVGDNAILLITNEVRTNQQIDHIETDIYDTFVILSMKTGSSKRTIRVCITPDKFE
jgi:hypothetical protein